jgi:hypothetical protein
VYSDVFAFKTTFASGTGRCCGSCTIPRTVPKMVPNAMLPKQNKTAKSGNTRRMKSLSPRGLGSRATWVAAGVSQNELLGSAGSTERERCGEAELKADQCEESRWILRLQLCEQPAPERLPPSGMAAQMPKRRRLPCPDLGSRTSNNRSFRFPGDRNPHANQCQPEPLSGDDAREYRSGPLCSRTWRVPPKRRRPAVHTPTRRPASTGKRRKLDRGAGAVGSKILSELSQCQYYKPRHGPIGRKRCPGLVICEPRIMKSLGP